MNEWMDQLHKEQATEATRRRFSQSFHIKTDYAEADEAPPPPGCSNKIVLSGGNEKKIEWEAGLGETEGRGEEGGEVR